MIPMDFDWLANVLARDYQGGNQKVKNINTDTRTLCDGEVFLALQGPNFDGHKFVAQAKEKGAIAAIVARPVNVDIVQFVVSDTRIALGQIGTAVMAQVAPKTIAITGSVGKTTVKEMCAAILSDHGEVLATKGNFNNDIGVPKTWFNLTKKHQRVLLEFGANARGEIEWLGEFSKPHISLLLNAGEAHTEGFGGIEGVRLAKGEIIDTTDPEGGVVLNQDDPAFNNWLKRAGDRKVVSFGKRTDADVCLLTFENSGTGSEFTLSMPDGDISVTWSMLGRHMAMNAAAAAAMAWLAGVSELDIAQGLSEMKPEPGRMEPVESTYGGPLIHDA